MNQRRPRSANSQLVVVVALAAAIAFFVVPELIADLSADDRSLVDWLGLVVLAVALVLLPVGVVRVYRQRGRQ